MRVKVTNPRLVYEERTQLSSDYTSGTSITVRNNNGAQNQKFVVVGEPGQERTETKQITSTTGTTTITLSGALSFSHPKSTVVYIFIYDKISFERKPSGGSFSEISGSPFDIDWDNEDNTTMITVPSGVSTDTYRWRFYNSASGTYSDYSDELSGSGISRSKAGYVLLQVRKNPITQGIDDETIFKYMNDYQSLVYEEMPKAWWFTREGTSVSTAADTYKYSISSNWSDFNSMKILLYNYVNGSTDETYPLTFTPIQEFYNKKADSNQTSDDNVREWTLLPPDGSSALGYIGLHPTPSSTSCAIKPVYEIELTDVNSFGDTLVIPDPKGYVDYVFYRIYDEIKNDTTNSVKYNARVARSIAGLSRRQKRQLGQPELFRYRGHRGWSRMFGSGGIQDSSEARENYW